MIFLSKCVVLDSVGLVRWVFSKCLLIFFEGGGRDVFRFGFCVDCGVWKVGGGVGREEFARSFVFGVVVFFYMYSFFLKLNFF